MTRPMVALLLVMLAVAFGVVSTVTSARIPPLLRLSLSASGHADAIEQRVTVTLRTAARLLVATMGEEGIPDAALPTGGVEWADMAERRSRIVGRYDQWSDAVGLNERYLSDPAWQDRHWLGTLAHELVHAQGVHDESLTEMVATETMAASCDAGWEAACADLWESWAWEAALSVWVDDPAAAEPVIRGLGGERGWARWHRLRRLAGEDYARVLRLYVVLPRLLEAICGEGSITVPHAIVTEPWYGVGDRPEPTPPLVILVDDAAWQARELGWDCG